MNPDQWTDPGSKTANVEAATACLYHCKLREQCAQIMGEDMWTIHGGNAKEMVMRKGRRFSKAKAVRVRQIGDRAQCPQCQCIFVMARTDQVTCGKAECVKANSAQKCREYQKKRRRNKPVSRCQECGEKFTDTVHANRRYHEECVAKVIRKTKARNNRRRWKQTESRTCEWCGGQYVCSRLANHRKFCGEECRNEWRTQRSGKLTAERAAQTAVRRLENIA
jgi:hypothetical protein